MTWGYFQNDVFGSRNPLRLYRDVEHGRIAGVCAGIALYFGVRPKLVRIATILGMVFGFFAPILIVYVILALVLKPVPGRLFASEREEQFWRSVNASPNDTASALRERFRSMDRKLAEMEARATSEEFDLRRKFDALKD